MNKIVLAGGLLIGLYILKKRLSNIESYKNVEEEVIKKNVNSRIYYLLGKRKCRYEILQRPL